MNEKRRKNMVNFGLDYVNLLEQVILFNLGIHKLMELVLRLIMVLKLTI